MVAAEGPTQWSEVAAHCIGSTIQPRDNRPTDAYMYYAGTCSTHSQPDQHNIMTDSWLLSCVFGVLCIVCMLSRP